MLNFSHSSHYLNFNILCVMKEMLKWMIMNIINMYGNEWLYLKKYHLSQLPSLWHNQRVLVSRVSQNASMKLCPCTELHASYEIPPSWHCIPTTLSKSLVKGFVAYVAYSHLNIKKKILISSYMECSESNNKYWWWAIERLKRVIFQKP